MSVGRIIVFIAILSLGINATVQAGTMRCAQGVVTQGDSRADVRRDCGAPQFTERVSGPTVVKLLGSARYAKRKVELWHYNFGPRSLMHEVYFVDGKVQIIQTGAYGIRPSD